MALASFYPILASPGDVNLFEHGGFGEPKITLRPGFKGNLANLGFNDRMSSL